MTLLRPWIPPRCPRCRGQAITAELVNEETGTVIERYCQACGVWALHEQNHQAAQREREARWSSKDRGRGA